MTKPKRNTAKASNRIFYTAPRHWKIWQLFFTMPALVLFVLSMGFTIALINLP
jgi:hypothetical protein